MKTEFFFIKSKLDINFEPFQIDLTEGLYICRYYTIVSYSFSRTY